MLVLNVVVALSKLGYGLLTKSLGMQADGFHSLFDGLSNVIGLTGIWFAARPPDASHPYGHKKYETVAAAGIGMMLLGTCLYLLHRSVLSIQADGSPEVTGLSFGIMAGTLAVNVAVTTWERRKGTALNSQILLADSYHTASDVLTSVSVILGLLAVRMGYPLLDPLVALLIVVVIAWTALTVFKDVLHSLADRTRLKPEEVCAVVRRVPGVLGCHEVRTRGTADHVFVDLSIHVGTGISIEQAHDISHRVEAALIGHFPSVEDVVVHIEPAGHEADEPRSAEKD